jgi:Domain of unknown function (DUF4350)
MKERLLVLALAAGALGLFYLLLFPKPQSDQEEMGLPLSTESRPEGYLAVARWLGEQRIPTASLRYRYDRLPASLPKPTGNLLVMSMPQRVPMRTAETAALDSWVERGNTLLILAALLDTPPWVLSPDSLLKEHIEHLTGLQVRSPVAKVDLKALLADRLDVQPRGSHPLMAGVRHITALSKFPLRVAQLRGGNDVLPFELGARTDNDEPALWLVRRGAGQVLLSAVASPFSNGAVALGDNAQLLANIVAWCREAGGTVVFDDAHQGATAYYDGRAFFADPRLHRTLGWILLLWLAMVLGALPLRAARRTWQPVDETAYVEASARYLAAVVPPNAAAQRLIERFLQGAPSAVHSGEERPLWASFDTDPRVPPAQRRELHAIYEKACAGKRINLTRLQRLLAQLRRNQE